MGQLVVDAAIDINTHLLAAAGKSAPRDAFSSFAELDRLGVLKREKARRLAATAGLRNRLVHRYDTIDLCLLHGALRPLIRRYRSYCAAIRARIRE